jgi:hypothetical protein
MLCGAVMLQGDRGGIEGAVEFVGEDRDFHYGVRVLARQVCKTSRVPEVQRVAPDD